MNSSNLVGDGIVFDRGPHVPVTHVSYFKAPMGELLDGIKSNYRRSSKELEYVNSEEVWWDLHMIVLEVAVDE